MDYIKVSFAITGEEQSDVLIALLSSIGYNGFEEAADKLLAYIEKPTYNEAELKDVAITAGAEYAAELVAGQNWNALWESNFSPVIIEGLCTIRADFHHIEVKTQYDILITPKMSFGTGHHATTQLMMQLMNEQDLKWASVLDFGTGTGVLAILAEMMGAESILAIDNDDWCVENANENVMRNNCRHIAVKKGSLEASGHGRWDFILANINRHILLEHMHSFYEKLNEHGMILMSGLLVEDKDIIVDAATAEGLIFKEVRAQANWIALLFSKT
jgi:ribosomal protein L11 methyltransferase